MLVCVIWNIRYRVPGTDESPPAYAFAGNDIDFIKYTPRYLNDNMPKKIKLKDLDFNYEKKY